MKKLNRIINLVWFVATVFLFIEVFALLFVSILLDENCTLESVLEGFSFVKYLSFELLAGKAHMSRDNNNNEGANLHFPVIATGVRHYWK